MTGACSTPVPPTHDDVSWCRGAALSGLGAVASQGMKINDVIVVAVVTVVGTVTGATILWRSTCRAISNAVTDWQTR